jgi:L-rhamnose 1-dehydrogenase
MAALPAWNLLKGKMAAITGGTTGIGRAIVLAFITQGCNVAVNHLGLPKDDTHRHSLIEEVKAIEKSGVKAGKIWNSQAMLPTQTQAQNWSTKLCQNGASEISLLPMPACSSKQSS